MMKRLFPFVTFSIYLFLSFTSTGSFRLHWPQTYNIINGELSYWSSMEMGGVQVAATYNKPALEFKQSWAKRSTNDHHWSLYDVFLNKYFSVFKQKIIDVSNNPEIKDLVPEFSQFPFTVQCWAECASSLDETDDFTYKVALNNTYEVRFDLIRKEWVAVDNPKVKVVEEILQNDIETKNLLKQYMKGMCKQLADLFSEAGIDFFSKKVQPEVFIMSHSDESETEVFCMVTGFYPKPINVSLWKENKIEDALSTETLPNGDGTYQITVSATVNVKEEQSVYCRVEHSSYKSPVIVHQKKKSHLAAGLVVGFGVPVVLCTVALVYYIKKYKK